MDEEYRKESQVKDHELFMRLACIAATRSRDKKTKVGAVIVRNGREVIATGYNGLVQHRLTGADQVGDNDEEIAVDEDKMNVVHAEHNAILNAGGKDIAGCKLYVTRNPCCECAKFVINTGIGEVIHHEDKLDEKDKEIYAAAKTMMKTAKVDYKTYSEALRAAGENAVPEPTKYNPEENSDRPEWEQYFMAMAKVAAQRSEDPRTQVGAVIVNANKRLVGIGYNAMPYGCEEALRGEWQEKPETTQGADELRRKKHLYVVHAVQMAIMNRNTADLTDCKLYVTLFPDIDCAKSIIQAKIKKVIYLEDSKKDKPETEASKKLLKWAGVKHRFFKSACEIKLRLLNENISLKPSTGDGWEFTSESVATDSASHDASS